MFTRAASRSTGWSTATMRTWRLMEILGGIINRWPGRSFLNLDTDLWTWRFWIHPKSTYSPTDSTFSPFLVLQLQQPRAGGETSRTSPPVHSSWWTRITVKLMFGFREKFFWNSFKKHFSRDWSCEQWMSAVDSETSCCLLQWEDCLTFHTVCVSETSVLPGSPQISAFENKKVKQLCSSFPENVWLLPCGALGSLCSGVLQSATEAAG